MTAEIRMPLRRRGRPRELSRDTIRFAPTWLSYGLMIVFFLLITLPLLWIAMTALRSPEAYAQNPVGGFEWRFSNFADAWNTANFSSYVPNSLIYTGSVVVLVVAIASAAGYGLARFRFPGRLAMMLSLVVALTVPFSSIMFSVYDVVQFFGLINTRAGIVVVAVAMTLPFATFYMRTFFLGIPDELAEAARIDGAGELTVFFRVMLPLARPGLATLAVFSGVWTWGMYIEPLLLATSDDLRTVSLGLSFFTTEFGGSNAPLICAAIVTIVAPLIVVSVLLQRRFVEGMTNGAIK